MFKCGAHTVLDIQALIDDNGVALVDGPVIGYGKDKDIRAESVADALVSIKRKAILAKRREVYMKESDPLYIEWQFDQTPESEQAWREKVNEIKSSYPLPA